MQGSANTLSMEEAAARQVVLAQAIEMTDTQAQLVTIAERAAIDQQAIAAARSRGDTSSPAAIRHFLAERAGLIVEAARKRNAAVAGWAQTGSWEHRLATGIPIAALVLGLLADPVLNPHQINLLSKPLLLLVFWNLAVYAILFVRYVLARDPQPGATKVAWLPRWVEALSARQRRRSNLASNVTSAFVARWHAVAAPLSGARVARVMHLSAAAWGVGAAVSLVLGGLLVKYRVEWESTWLSPENVHLFLSILFRPVTVMFPVASFTLDEVRALEAGVSPVVSGVASAAGRRWVFLYATLLALAVVVPRLVLAGWAGWRERRFSRALHVDVGDSYFEGLIGSLHPGRIQLAIHAHRDQDRAVLLRVLQPDGQTLAGPGGEELRIVDLPEMDDPVELARMDEVQPAGWSGKIVSWLLGETGPHAPPDNKLLKARQEVDTVLHVADSAGDIEAAAPLLEWLDRPVLLLASTQDQPAPPGALHFDDFARCWFQERALFDAIGRCLPAYKAEAFGKIVGAWEGRNLAQLREAMSVIAQHLLEAARQVEDVGTAPRSLISLVSPGERDAHERKSREAMAAVVTRLQQSDAQSTTRLLALHGMAPGAARELNHRLEEKFVVQNAISATQAGMAGAATGATVGVSIDLLTAGFSLGLGAAAGAVIGGGAAWIAAIWKNQATPAGNSVVQLSDEMLQAMVEAGLLRYLAVIHLGRGSHDDAGAEIRPGWRSEVVAAVDRRSDDLKQQWTAARSRQESLDPAAALVSMLESITLAVLRRLYPAVRSP